MWVHSSNVRVLLATLNITSGNRAIDDKLLAEAQRIGRHQTKKETVTAALMEYVAMRKQRLIISLFGTIDYDHDYDSKRERWRPRGPNSRGR